jgi:hypothetical protein
MDAETLRNMCDPVSRIDVFAICFLKLGLRDGNCLRFVRIELFRARSMEAFAQLFGIVAASEGQGE